MTPQQLYNRPEESATNDLNILFGVYSNYNHLPELDKRYELLDDGILEKNDKVVIKILKDFHFDTRRYWRLATVWFEEHPVMIIRNAGREGDDHVSRFVTDESEYRKMVEYIKTLLPVEFVNVSDVVDIHQDIEKLDEFYGDRLDGYFMRSYY